MTQALLPNSEKPMAGILATELTAQRDALRDAVARGTDKLKRGAVHDMRVAVRRLESTIGLARALGSKPRQRLERQLDALLQALSPLRDAHVARRSVDGLPPIPEGQKQLGRHVAKQKRRLEPKVERHLADFDLGTVERDLEELSHSLSALDRLEGGEPDDALRKRLDRLRASIEGMRSIASAEDPKSLHRLRIALKRYRYALEALGPRLPPESQDALRTAEALQKLLGQAHDAHQLAKLARRHAKKHPKLKPLARALRQASDSAQRAGADESAKAQLG
jgi:CHAD domain-containing protein